VLTVSELNQRILRLPNYPKPGIIFQDITPLLSDPSAFNSLIEHMSIPFHDLEVSHVVGIEARGFLLAGAIAQRLAAGLVPARKAGKLPRETYYAEYQLEYGSAAIEIHQDAMPKNSRVLIVDDVLATGGTIGALVTVLSKIPVDLVGITVISEITELNGRVGLPAIRINSLIT